ncbi:MAG TPA: hypothetical protein VHC18_24695 [Amycolatopsis sp.]|nr:hypothetical protein [Amycolatopsis sp.]
MSSPEPSAAEVRLLGLIDRGYRFLHPCDEEGAVVAVVGVRAHHAVVDVVRLDGEDDVTAVRVPADEPDVFAPGKVLWRSHGDACEVLDELLALPDIAPARLAI